MKVQRARLARWRGDRGRAATLVGEAEAALSTRGFRLDLVACRVERGRQALADGRSARRVIRELRALVSELALPPGSPSVEDRERLARAPEAADAGVCLLAGELPSDLTDAVAKRRSGASGDGTIP